MDRGLNSPAAGVGTMATQTAHTEGQLSNAIGQTGVMNPQYSFNPVTYNQTYIAYYKMQGKNSTGWDSWTNNTGDETGRPVTAGQEAATIVASWFIPQGF